MSIFRQSLCLILTSWLTLSATAPNLAGDPPPVLTERNRVLG